MSKGYRQRPLSQRLGISFPKGSHWRVEMEHAECFMYFVAGLGQVLDPGTILYLEGTQIDPDLAVFYERFAAAAPQRVMPLLRHPRAEVYHLDWMKETQRELARYAASKTYAEICDAMLAYRAQEVYMDASRLGERIVLFSGSLSEGRLRKFCRGKLRGEYQWIEEREAEDF